MGNWSINPHELASIDDNGKAIFQEHTEDVEYTITYNDNVTGASTKKFMVYGCGVDCSVYNFTTSTSIIDPMSGNIPIAHSSHLNNLEQLSYTIKDSGGFLTGITAYTIYEDEREWEYRGYFNTTTSSSDRTATIEYKNGDGTCVFKQELVMKGEIDCSDKYGWTGNTLQQGVRDNVGGPVGYSVTTADTLVLYSKPNWVTFITATTSSDRIAYICKAEDNSGRPRSGDVVFRSPDGKCEFSGTVEQAAQTIQVYLTFGGLPSNLKSGGLTVVGSTYSVNFPLAGPNVGKGTLYGSINPSDTRDKMTFSGQFTTVSAGGSIVNSCDGHQSLYYTVSTASWNLATKTLDVNFTTCS